jgi:NAD(P)-dependent dehydrogenase (short-subunit alcohol dehydrogenase family)
MNDRKHILVTGASRGIGRYLCSWFASRGADVIGTVRTSQNTPEQYRTLRMDLKEPDSIENLAARLKESMPRLDILINNAADTTSKPLRETSFDEIDSLVRTNVTGMLQLCRAVAPWMAETGGGAIVNISSLAGYKPNPSQTAYCVSKSAVNGASDAIRAEFAPCGIRVLNVALPSIAVDGDPKPGQVPVAVYAARLERAIERGDTELFLSPITKWLMRLYHFYPPLSRLR